MTTFLKSLVHRCDGYLFGPGTVPKGVDLFRDLHRYGYSSHVRTVFDVGANVGQFATAVTKALPDACLMSFEPVKSTFEELSRNLSSFSNVKVFRSAVGATEGELRITSAFHSVTNHLLPPGASAPTGVETELVPVQTISEICTKLQVNEIGLLKTDTEGFDLDVLRGAERMLSDGRVFLVLVEVGFSDDDKGHTPFGGVRELLKGFDLAGFYDQGADANFSCLDRADALFIHRELANRRLPVRWK